MPRKNAGNLRFTDAAVLPFHYRQRFLHYTEQEAPEVLETLKALCPKYDAVINHYPYTETLSVWLRGDYEVDDPQVAELHRRNILNCHLAVKDRYNITDLSLLPEAEEKAWKNCIDLKVAFAEFLEKYGLTSDWLRSGLFSLLGDIARNPKHFNSLCYAYSHAWFPAHGDEIDLKIDGWAIEESWQDFEKRARRQFEASLSKHLNATLKYFRESGYKQATKPLDFTSVKWLVLWTVKRISKAEILKLIDIENEANGKTYDLKSLEKAFRALKKFDLPVRIGNKSMS